MEEPTELRKLHEARREGDADAARLIANCAVNPIAIQRETVRKHRESDSIDWTQAHWQHPLLQQLGDLSILSSYDMPFRQHLIERLQTELPVSHPAAARLHEISPSAVLVKYNPSLLVESQGALPTEFDRTFFSKRAPGSAQVDTATWNRTPPPIEHRPVVEPAAIPSCLYDMKQLLELSSDTLRGDANLQHVVASLAERYKSDPAVARRLLENDGAIPMLDTSSRGKPEATELPRRPVNSPNKAFHDSDIVAYPQIVGIDETNGVKSMHDVGYLTWAQRAIDLGARSEDDGGYVMFREQLTSAQGQQYAVEGRLEKLTDV